MKANFTTVSGNRILAVRKQLTAFGSGDETTYKSVKKVIQSFANSVHYVGPFGNGMKMKFCANILNLVHNSIAAEVMVLGMKSGLDPKLINLSLIHISDPTRPERR